MTESLEIPLTGKTAKFRINEEEDTSAYLSKQLTADDWLAFTSAGTDWFTFLTPAETKKHNSFECVGHKCKLHVQAVL